MRPHNSAKLIGAIVLALALIGVGIFLVLKSSKPIPAPAPTPVAVRDLSPKHTVIGKSVQGRDIDAYVYGTGPRRLLFVGGIHGGYEWNSVLLAYRFMDYIKANPSIVAENVSLAIIPDANPDGVFAVTGKTGRFAAADVSEDTKTLSSARFNANEVDLNRNFDCKWQPKSTWQQKTVSAGQSAFSEPESVALRDFISGYGPSAAVFWHSQSNAVYASQCEGGILPVTLDIMDVYAKASDYPAVKVFGAYETTGAADDWLASIKVPAITVELKTHETIEWDRNLAGIKALIKYFNGLK